MLLVEDLAEVTEEEFSIFPKNISIVSKQLNGVFTT